MIYDSRDRVTCDALNGYSLPGTAVRTEGGGPTNDSVVDTTHDNMGVVYNYYSAIFGRDSFDDAGGTITASVHYGLDYNNAYWDGNLQQFAFGDGDGVNFAPFGIALDVTAHEFTHGVTQYDSGLIYYGESGALNEAVSDIFGAMCEAWNAGSISSNTWKVGEDVYTPGVPNDAMRYMDNPTYDGVSADWYLSRYQGSADNGGVHWNSGIANLAFKLLVTGGSHPRGVMAGSVPALGADAAQRIFYRANNYWAYPSCTFADFRSCTIFAALDLYGSTAAYAVSAAWDVVAAPGCNYGMKIALQSASGQYVRAENGGAEDIYANGSSASSFEKFAMADENGGALNSGDIINLRAYNCQWLCAENGGGQNVVANRNFPSIWERLRIIKLNGSDPITTGDQVAIQVYNGQYLCAENGGGGTVVANRNAIGSWETFTFYIWGP
jgi:hypothetical protein